MISHERLLSYLKTPALSTTDEIEMAKELLARRPCRHNWSVLRLVEAGGRYQYCTLCGAKKVAE